MTLTKPLLIGAAFAISVASIAFSVASYYQSTHANPLTAYDQIVSDTEKQVAAALASDPDYQTCERKLDAGDPELTKEVADYAKAPMMTPTSARRTVLLVCSEDVERQRTGKTGLGAGD